MEETRMVSTDTEMMILGLTGDAPVQYCSFRPTNDKERAVLFNAMNNPDYRLSECIGKTIELKHVFCEVVNCTNDETGEITSAPRVVLIDSEGASYQGVSVGIYSAIKKLFLVMGTPDKWKNTVNVKVEQITKGKYKMMTISMV